MYTMILLSYDRSSEKDKECQPGCEAKAQTSKDHAEGKPSSETVNKAKVKVRDALT
jgi:hypothetical protein